MQKSFFTRWKEVLRLWIYLVLRASRSNVTFSDCLNLKETLRLFLHVAYCCELGVLPENQMSFRILHIWIGLLMTYISYSSTFDLWIIFCSDITSINGFLAVVRETYFKGSILPVLLASTTNWSSIKRNNILYFYNGCFSTII